jgi:hypothetical protein
MLPRRIVRRFSTHAGVMRWYYRYARRAPKGLFHGGTKPEGDAAAQPFEMAQGFGKAAANASRTLTELLSALDRKRGKGGQQKVTVEHVHVHAGGQAIVGAVTPGAPGEGDGAKRKFPKKPHVSPAKLAHDPASGAVLPTLPRPDPKRPPLPVARNEKRQVPQTRRPEHGPSNGRED